MACGVACVALGWWRAPSLWLDEIFVALNLRDRELAGLVRPLDYRQLAPIGFLAVEKAALVLLGAGERTLRLLPGAAVAVAFALLPALLRRFSGPLGVAAATWLAVTLAPLYGATLQLKPAGFDLLAGVAVPLAFLVAHERGAREKRIAGAVAAGLALVSFGAWLAVAGTLLGMLVARGTRRSLLGDAAWRLPLLVAAGSAGAAFVVARGQSSGASGEFLRYFWRHVLPAAGSAPEPEWPLRWLANTGGWLAGASGRAAVLVLAVVGLLAAVRAARARRAPVAIPGAIVAAAAAVTALGLYPVAGRLSLFLAPCWLTVAAAAIDPLEPLVRGRGRALVAVALVAAGAWRVERLESGRARERPRELVAALAGAVASGDRILVRYGAVPAWRWYGAAHELPAGAEVELGECARHRPAAYADEVGRLRGARRAWIVFSHTSGQPDHERALLEGLAEIGTEDGAVAATGEAGAVDDVARLWDFGDQRRFDPGRLRARLAALPREDERSCWQFERAAGATP